MSYVATFVAGQGLTLAQSLLAEIAQETKALRVEWLAEDEAADIFCAADSEAALYGLIKQIAGNEPVDVIVQPAHNRRKKVLVADMESTIIEQEMLDELAAAIGAREKVSAITRRAMNGEIDFAAALRERVSLLKGQSASVLDRTAGLMTFTLGAATLVLVMRQNGAGTYLVSGGFTRFAEPVARELGFDGFFANELIVRDGVILGTVQEPVLDKTGKKAILEKIGAALHITMADCLSIGDGANDIPMLEACLAGGGLGVAYKAKPAVRAAIPHQINHSDLTALLYAQGYTKSALISSSGT